MLWNYRPDQITAPKGYRAPYVGLMNSEFGHKRAEVDENLTTTRLQQLIDKGADVNVTATEDMKSIMLLDQTLLG